MRRERRPHPPPGYRTIRTSRALAWVDAAPSREEIEAWVSEALFEGRTLYEAAAAGPGPGTPPGKFLGRLPLFVVERGDQQSIVRRYSRGGAIAPILGDRYLRAGTPRPFHELLASRVVGEAGIRTPRVLAAAVYPSGAFYRGDLVTEFAAGTMDLAALLFGSTGGAATEVRGVGSAAGPTAPPSAAAIDDVRTRALVAAVELIGVLASRGIQHADLNAKNILVTAGDPEMLHLLDLDRCRTGLRPSLRLHLRMTARLRRSLARWEAHSGCPLARQEWEAFDNACHASMTPDMGRGSDGTSHG